MSEKHGKRCIVPGCKITSYEMPKKHFMTVPRTRSRRAAWLKAIRCKKYATNTCLYVCEDHFNLKEDAENWLQIQFGLFGKITLKKTVVPHIFQCQPYRSNAQPPKERPAAAKRARKALLHDLLRSPVKARSPTCTALRHVTAEKNEEPTDYSLTLSAPTEEPSENELCMPSLFKQPMVFISPRKRAAADALCSLYEVDCKRSRHVTEERCTSEGVAKVHSEPKTFIEKRSQGVTARPSVQNKGLTARPSVQNKGLTAKPPARSIGIWCRLEHKGPMKSIATSPIKVKRSPSPQDVDTEETSSRLSDEETSSLLSDESCSSYKPSSEDASDNEQDYISNLRIQEVHLYKIKRNPRLFIGVPKEYFYLVQSLAECVPTETLKVLICLQKIRLGDTNQLLAEHFGVSESYVSTTFTEIIPALADCISSLVLWPDALTIKRRLPLAFSARYYHVQSVIDCFEIQVQQASDAIKQTLSWSNYKKCNTLKYCLSITPDGLISFVSKGYGGRTSDSKIVETCGYLDILPDGASVLADRGFKGVATLLAKKNCKLIRPPSVSSSEQCSKEQVRDSKRISSLRIHVERVIRRIREFKMLQPNSCVHSSLRMYMDCIVKIGCGLVNLQSPLIQNTS